MTVIIFILSLLILITKIIRSFSNENVGDIALKVQSFMTSLLYNVKNS